MNRRNWFAALASAVVGFFVRPAKAVNPWAIPPLYRIEVDESPGIITSSWDDEPSNRDIMRDLLEANLKFRRSIGMKITLVDE